MISSGENGEAPAVRSPRRDEPIKHDAKENNNKTLDRWFPIILICVIFSYELCMFCRGCGNHPFPLRRRLANPCNPSSRKVKRRGGLSSVHTNRLVNFRAVQLFNGLFYFMFVTSVWITVISYNQILTQSQPIAYVIPAHPKPNLNYF